MELHNNKFWLFCSASWFQEEGRGVGDGKHQPAGEGRGGR